MQQLSALCYAPLRQTDTTRRQWLAAYAARLHHLVTEQPLEVGDY
jgi:hypothetical protein